MRLGLLGTSLVLAQMLTLSAQEPAIPSSGANRPLASSAQRIQGLSGVIRPSAFARITGTALDANHKPLSNRAVRLRDTRSGKIVAMALTDRGGLFAFQDVDPGNYVVELIATDETVLAASNMITVTAGDAVSTIVKLPIEVRSLVGLLGHHASAAAIVTSSAAAAGVLAVRVKDCVSPPCEN
jgi:hypothetical protein